MKCFIHTNKEIEIPGDISFYYKKAEERYKQYLSNIFSNIEKGIVIGNILDEKRTIGGWAVEEAFYALCQEDVFNLDPNFLTKTSLDEDRTGVDFKWLNILLDVKRQSLDITDSSRGWKNGYINFPYVKDPKEVYNRIDKERFRIIVIANFIEDNFHLFGFIHSLQLREILRKGNAETSDGKKTLFCNIADLYPNPLSAVLESNFKFATFYKKEIEE